MPRDRPEDDGEDGDDDSGEERDPKGASEEELANVRLSDAYCSERSLRRDDVSEVAAEERQDALFLRRP